MSDTPSTPFLEVKDLKVHFPTDDGLVKSVDGLSFSVERGKTLGIVGESGSGKSVTSQAVLGLHRGTRARTSGQILLDGEDLMSVDNDRMRQLRGRKMSMIFQDPLSALHPYYTIGSQIIEAIQNTDLPVIVAVVVVASFFIVIANLVVDVLYGVIDPRVRLS